MIASNYVYKTSFVPTPGLSEVYRLWIDILISLPVFVYIDRLIYRFSG